VKAKIVYITLALVLVLSFSLVTAVPAAADGTPVSGYGVAISGDQTPGDGGWAGVSVPAGKVVLAGGFSATAPVAASAPAGTTGWDVQDAPGGVSNTITIYAIYADEPAGYGVAISSLLNYADGGWGGHSVPAGKVVLGGGFHLTGGPAAVSAPGTPNSVWPHYTYPDDEYGWAVCDDPDGHSSPNSRVYAIYADEPADGGGGCFIATAAYGTSSAEEIDTLRAFRDEVLLESTVGSQLVEWYYQTSPPVADFISENAVLKALVRELVVDPIASLVEAMGTFWRD
jgi:hypothetical protein